MHRLNYCNDRGWPLKLDLLDVLNSSCAGQVRKVATGPRRKDFFKLLPGVDVDKVFSDYPKVFMMDLKKVLFIIYWCTLLLI